MNCNEALPLLDLLYDELLETKDAALVLDHLKNCDNCRREWESMEELRARIKLAKNNTIVPPDLSDKISAVIKHDVRKKRFKGLQPNQIPITTIAASILLLGWIIVPQLLHSQQSDSGTLAQSASANKLIADLTASGATVPESDKGELDRRLGYNLKYVHLPAWRLRDSGIYVAQKNIARFDFVHENNEDEKLCCYQGMEGTIQASGDSEEISGKRVTFGTQAGYHFAKFTQNGRDYLFITKLPKPILEDIIRGA